VRCFARSGGGHGDDRLSTVGAACTAHEIHLSAGAAELEMADHLGIDLSAQIDLQGGVDGDHVVMLADDAGIIHVVNGMHFDSRMLWTKL